MNVLIDHNMSFRIARALNELLSPEHSVVALRDRFPTSISDEEWIKRLSAEGSWVVISGDRRIARNKAEYRAFRASRLIGFFLSKGLFKEPVIKQTERILAVWPKMVTTVEIMQPGAMFEIPMRSTRLDPL